MATEEAPKAFVFFHYDPSKAAAIVMVILFAVSSTMHIFQLFRKRTWYFIPFVIGGVFECVGYIGRAMAADQSPNWTIMPYVMQSLLILLAPAFFAASIYMVLGRIIHLVDGESHSIIRAKWLTKIFVGGDVLSFLAQSSGGGMQARAKTQDDSKMGQNIILGGLGLQLLFFGFFIVVAGSFHYRISRFPTTCAATTKLPWQRYLLVMYTASLLIMVRSIFRIVEYVMGSDGVLLSNEVYLYIFDAALMFIAMALFNAFHPGSIIPKRAKGNLDSEDHDGMAYNDNEERSMGSPHPTKSHLLQTLRPC